MGKLVVSITHAKDNSDKATVGFVVANAGVASAQESYVFLSTEGVHLIAPGYVDDIHEEGFKPLRELMQSFVEAGGTILVCSPCFKRRGLDENAVQFGGKIVGGAVLVEILSQGAACISY
jgi:predicted peroxiredoxin